MPRILNGVDPYSIPGVEVLDGAENVVLQFRPREGRDMLVPCVWDHWQQHQESLDSVALITDEPPEEVAAAGHDRCPVNLTRSAAEAWLVPEKLKNARVAGAAATAVLRVRASCGVRFAWLDKI